MSCNNREERLGVWCEVGDVRCKESGEVCWNVLDDFGRASNARLSLACKD